MAVVVIVVTVVVVVVDHYVSQPVSLHWCPPPALPMEMMEAEVDSLHHSYHQERPPVPPLQVVPPLLSPLTLQSSI